MSFLRWGAMGADAADLDGDRREVGEAAQGIGGHGDALGAQQALLDQADQVDISHEFVQDDLGAEEAPEVEGVGGRHADPDGQVAQDHSEDELQGERLAEVGREIGVDPQQVAQAGQQVVDHGDAGDEGQQHGAHVQGQVQAVAGAGGRRFDDVGGVLLHLELDRALGHRDLGLGVEDLGDDERGRGGHDAGREQLDGEADLGFGQGDASAPRPGPGRASGCRRP